MAYPISTNHFTGLSTAASTTATATVVDGPIAVGRVIVLVTNGGSTVPAVTGLAVSAGAVTWTPNAGGADGTRAGTQRVAVHVGVVTTAIPNGAIFTVTWGASTNRKEIIGDAFSGVDTTGIPNAGGNSNGSSTAGTVSTSGATTSTPVLVVAGFGGTAALVPSGGEVTSDFIVTTAGSAERGLTVVYRRDVSATGTKTIAGTFTPTQGYAAAIVALTFTSVRVNKTTATTWDVRARVTKTVGTTWDVASSGGGLTRVNKTTATTWDVRSRASKTTATTWDVASVVSATAYPAYAAHRGGNPGPEEALYAYQQSYALSPTFAAEGDMQQLSTGQIVLCHDDTIDRTASASSPITTGAITSLTATQWATILWKVNSGFTGPDRPAAFLSDLLTEYGPSSGKPRLLMPEIKAGTSASACLTALAGFKGQCIVQAFTLSDAQAAATAGFTALHLTNAPDFPTLVASGIGHIGVAFGSITGTIVTNAHANGIKVWVYTINNTTDRDTCLALGVDGFFSNNPATIATGTRVAKTTATSWNVSARVAKAVAASWDVRARVAKTVAATTWDVRARSGKTTATSWSVLSRVTASRATTWDVRSRVTKTLGSTTWSVRARVAKLSATTWDVRARVARATATSWNVRARVAGLARVASWNVLTRSTKTVGTTWDVLAATQQPAVTVTAVAAHHRLVIIEERRRPVALAQQHQRVTITERTT